ncbi:MAG: hypothetical protein WDW36_008727 [Sanguina aurantia]
MHPNIHDFSASPLLKLVRLSSSFSNLAGTTCVGNLPAPLQAPQVLVNPDLIKLLFQHLPAVEICRFSCVAAPWKIASSSDDLWTDVSFLDTAATFEQVLGVCRRHRHIRNLALPACALAGFPQEALTRELAPCVLEVLTLEIGRGAVLETALTPLLASLPSITCLTLSSAQLQSGARATAFHVAHPRLTELLMPDCSLAGSLGIRCPQLRNLSLRRTALTALALQAPLLTSLDLAHCGKLEDEELRRVLVRQTLLVELDLTGLCEVSDTTIGALSDACRCLSILSLRNCRKVTLHGEVSLSLLRVLDASGTGVTRDHLVAALRMCHTLEELVLDRCQALDRLCLRMGQLKVVSLVGCHHMSALDLHCPALESLRLVPQPGEGGCRSLKQISLSSDALLTLELRECPVLDQLALECCRLVELRLQECDALGDEVFEMLSDTPLHYQQHDSRLPPHPHNPQHQHQHQHQHPTRPSLPSPINSVLPARDASKPRLAHTLLPTPPPPGQRNPDPHLPARIQRLAQLPRLPPPGWPLHDDERPLGAGEKTPGVAAGCMGGSPSAGRCRRR